MTTPFNDAIARVQSALSWLPDWLAAIVILVLLAGTALVIHAVAMRLLRGSRFIGRSRTGALVLDRAAGPSRAVFLVLGIGAAIPAVGFSESATHALLRVDFAALLLVLGWAAIQLLNLTGDLYLARLPKGYEQDVLVCQYVM